MKKLLLFFLLLLSRQVFSQTSALTEDQKLLLTAALRQAFVTDKTFPDYHLLLNIKKIIVLDKMISESDPKQPPVFLTQELMPKFKQIKFKVLTEEALNKKKPKMKDLLFARLAIIDVPKPEDSEYAFVTLMGQLKLGKESLNKGYRYKPANGYSLLFKRNGKGWEFVKPFNFTPNWMAPQQ